MDSNPKTNVRVLEAQQRQAVVQETDSGVACPYCGRPVAADDEVCPHCGARLTSDCSFCGTRLLPGETECPECGISTKGVRCPSCGTLNHRPFCRVCNAPLTRAAVRAVEEAKADPVFQQCEAMAEKVEEIEKAIAAAPPAEAEELRKEKKKVVGSMNDLFKNMLPPAGSTPKEQMIFYSARKVAVNVTYTTSHKVGWVCNYCGCTHNKPAECTKPQLGGHWIYEEKEEHFIAYK